MQTAAVLLFSYTLVHHLSVLEESTKEAETSLLCGCKVRHVSYLTSVRPHSWADIPDQSQIVRQYMRYTGEFYSAATIPHVVHRGLQL